MPMRILLALVIMFSVALGPARACEARADSAVSTVTPGNCCNDKCPQQISSGIRECCSMTAGDQIPRATNALPQSVGFVPRYQSLSLLQSQLAASSPGA